MNDLVLHKGFRGIMLKNIAVSNIRACSLVMMEDALLLITNVGMQELTI